MNLGSVDSHHFLHRLVINSTSEHEWIRFFTVSCPPLKQHHQSIEGTAIIIQPNLFWNQKATTKNTLDQGWTDRFNLTHDPDLQSPASCGHDLLKHKGSRSRSVGSIDILETDERMDGDDCITSHANAVGNKKPGRWAKLLTTIYIICCRYNK